MSQTGRTAEKGRTAAGPGPHQAGRLTAQQCKRICWPCGSARPVRGGRAAAGSDEVCKVFGVTSFSVVTCVPRSGGLPRLPGRSTATDHTTPDGQRRRQTVGKLANPTPDQRRASRTGTGSSTSGAPAAWMSPPRRRSASPGSPRTCRTRRGRITWTVSPPQARADCLIAAILELNGYFVNALQLHVNAADLLVRRGMARDGSR